MATRRALTDYQSVGFGGLSFGTNMNFANLPMSYEQRLWALEALYSFAVAKIEDDKKFKEDKDVGMLIAGTRLLLDQAGKDYKSQFESHDSLPDLENNYRRLLCLIFEKLTQIQGKTKMIEHVQAEQMEA